MPDNVWDRLIAAAREALGKKEMPPAERRSPFYDGPAPTEHGSAYVRNEDTGEGYPDVFMTTTVEDYTRQVPSKDQMPVRPLREDRAPQTVDSKIKAAIEKLERQEIERQRVEQLRRRLTSGN